MQNLVIKKIVARKILDSRGDLTIEIEATVGKGRATGTAKAAAPRGSSKGKNEVVDFPGGGVDEAITKVGEIAPRLCKTTLSSQEDVDGLLHEIDGTPNLHVLGGNTTVAISMAVAKAAAAAKGLPLFRYLGGKGVLELPYPLGNIIGGGKHAGGRAPENQEFLVVPAGAEKFSDAALVNAKIHKKVGGMIAGANHTFTGGRGDEGAWAPNLSNEEALGLVVKACEEVGEEIGIEVRPALDVAASTFYDEKRGAYVYKREGVARDRGEQIDYILELIEAYKLFYVEDPLWEDDFGGFSELTKKVGRKCLICGDDLFTTNVERLQKGIKAGAANAVLIKPNQIGTLSDTLAAVRLAKKHG